ncbi:hypothetical protein NW759_011920 [Fusarium solani]|uniref:Flo11 n=1 Tax=Fusarium solani TaxID=169388 RepID=A0A9P9KQ99_FUSSL|nr:uncharacterized protein B0J15DRAFT_250789 [Fusarium solani]KAH7266536.1 hypothetical protein B0J15DRAFT_250789 [Fusarium solani]KAJ4212231.1 hypothetical protein NW759_011920 [Fusarium solani]
MAAPSPDLAMSRPTSGIVSPRGVRSRTQSISSDRPSTIAHSLMSPPLSVSPAAAFIAASAASQIVTNDHDSHADTWYDQHGIEPAGETALVSAEALTLVNSFLDQLLFNFLSISRATTLASLRPAVSEVLKPKLAKDAVNNADEELREYLGEGDEEDYVQPQGSNSSRDWDLELVWKRTRLRCMVYSSLGDMEEEDEDLYMEQENLEIGADEQVSDVISPAVAIFLTSVLEYMGELTLTVAGQAAYHRLRTRFQKEIKEGVRNPTDIADRIVVEEQDMERVALDRTLGRLWRGWKKRIRSPVIDLNGRPFSRASDSPALSRVATHSDAEAETKKSDTKASGHELSPSEIALPMGSNDVDEIEVPGLAINSDDEDEEEIAEESTGRRPKSLLISPLGITHGLPTPTLSQPNTPDFAGRKRSNSLPTPGTSPYRTALKRSKETGPTETSTPEDKQEFEDAKEEQTNDVQIKVEEEATAKEEATVEPVNSKNKRLAKIITTAPDAARSQHGADDDLTYEKAEILTSARVSVAGSSSPALSDTGGPFAIKRSSSVHSARLIDVAGPKSPSGSRSPSAEAADRIRRASLTTTPSSGLSNQVSVEDAQVPKVAANISRPIVTAPKSRSPVDGKRGSISNAATISESEEEPERERHREQRIPKYSAYQPSTPTVPEAVSPTERRRPQPIIASPHHSPTIHQSSSGTKVTVLRSTGVTETVPEERSTDVSRKGPGHSSRHASRSDKVPTSPTHSIGMVSIERSKTRDSDEDAPVPPRPIHTSGSSASSGTSRLKAVRTSEENASNRTNVARNFEELIQSNQTITYTLTPENMRDIDAKHSLDGSGAKGARKSEDTRAHNRSRSSSAATDMKKSSPHQRSAGFSDDRMKPLPSPNSGKSRMSAAPRDARVPSESTADFAEFIKSTGPTGDNRPTPLRNVSNPPTPTKTSLDTRRVSSASNRNRYMPRDAVTEARSGNSDLIDFIRQGPPGANRNRIPHNIAPFRDSEEMSGAVGGRAIDANIPDIRYSQASTHGTDTSMPSIHSSVNSNTALLKNKGAPAPTSKMFDDEDMMPKRKTRRVKDPYALDFSDEEDEDDFITTPKPPAKKEESLADFLRNYEPPPEPVTPPISSKVPKKKASAPSLIGRFTRRDSSQSSAVPPPVISNDTRSLNSRSGFKGYIPIQVNIPPGYDKYGPIDSGSSRPSQPASSSSSGRVPMKKFEPRDAVSNVSRTSDLAAFLRTSEPPPEPVITGPPKEESSGSSLSKMFGRRKK